MKDKILKFLRKLFMCHIIYINQDGLWGNIVYCDNEKNCNDLKCEYNKKENK